MILDVSSTPDWLILRPRACLTCDIATKVLELDAAAGSGLIAGETDLSAKADRKSGELALLALFAPLRVRITVVCLG
jgi:hypothetical protein